MKRNTIATLLKSNVSSAPVYVKGWVKTFRANRFISLNDGSTLANIQCVLDFENTDESTLKKITTGAAIAVQGILIESQGQGQKVEIQVENIKILGEANPNEYPIQPKKTQFRILKRKRAFAHKN